MEINKIISYGKQTIEQDDIDTVVQVLKSDWLTQGPNIEIFENALCQKFKAKYASAVSNGTAGLHLIGMALGWGKGDIVITTPITFVASANCILYTGATPDFVDINPISYTIDVQKLEERILEYQKNSKQIKAVVAVDFAGLPCDWVNLRKLADKYSFQLVNDNCHALGAEIDGDIGYAVQYADIVNMSFHPVKHITTGEGGAILTNNFELDKKVKLLRTHGITKDIDILTQNDGPWYYEMHELGYNYRITDFQCALGFNQLKKLDKFVERRIEIAKLYDSYFSKIECCKIPKYGPNVKHAYHLYPLLIDFSKLKIAKKVFFGKLKSKNIFLQVHYIPVPNQPFYKKQNIGQSDIANAVDFYLQEISLPIYPKLANNDVEYVCDTIYSLLK